MSRPLTSRVKMRTQNATERSGNFTEVTLGLSAEQAVSEAQRCLGCRHQPCVDGCPVGVEIPEFLALIAQGKFAAAEAKIKERNSLPAICGRVCPQEIQCEERCVLAKKGEAVAIGALERFVADYSRQEKAGEIPRGNQDVLIYHPRLCYTAKVAVVGSGPAGLSCAAELAARGYRVDVFESLHQLGGVLRYGIPEFRLPKQIVDYEIDEIKARGVRMMTNVVVGMTLDLQEMLNSGAYQAVFLATGAGLPYFLGISGEGLNGVYSANEFLTRANLMEAYLFPHSDTPLRIGNSVAVIGAGNVAMDVARLAIRMGSEKVTVVYRRSRAEMPARRDEIEQAAEEGIQFLFLANPTRILGNERGRVRALECIRMKLGDADASNRCRPEMVSGSQFSLEAETIVIAVGQGSNPLLTRRISGLAVNEKGNIRIYDEYGATNIPGIWAGGDAASGAATVISAMGAGKRSAEGIHRSLRSSESFCFL